ncbi:MAG: HAMP domain-containing histidine kinase [Anaerolineae bacterium]|nr:HAMP domain-containing histidine kinase [Anaerolineae bacterium]
MNRQQRRRIALILVCAAPAVLGIVASAILNRSLRPEGIPSLYLQADIVALSWIGGLLLSMLLAAILVLSIRQRRRNAAYREAQRAAIAQAGIQAAAIAAAEAAEARRRFLRRLDHELKNPLTAINAGLANLAEALPPDAPPEFLDSVKAQTARIGRLISDLRKLAELESRPFVRTPVDMAALLAEAVAAARDLPGAQGRDVTLTVPQAPWPLPRVAGDGDLLFLAVYNLLDNAIKFTGPGARVEVRAFEDNAVIIEVADTGPGIPEKELAHVWEELYRGKETRGTSGSGLGLALVRTVIERHGGHATVRSRAGQGTVFTLRLPATG